MQVCCRYIAKYAVATVMFSEKPCKKNDREIEKYTHIHRKKETAGTMSYLDKPGLNAA